MTAALSILAMAYTAIAAFGGRLIAALLVLFIGSKVIKWAIRKIDGLRGVQNMDPSLRTFTRSALTIALDAILVIVAAGALGIETSSFIAVLASCGVAVGLALQGALSNVAGGIMLLFFRPFRVGDYIECGGVSGTVKDLSIFYTTIETVDNKVITMPNSSLTGGAITNYSTNGNRRVDIDFDVDGGADIEEIKALMLQVASSHAKVLQDPAPFARVTGQGASSLKYTLRVWCKNADYWDVYFDMLETMRKTFNEKGVKVPFQTVELINNK